MVHVDEDSEFVRFLWCACSLGTHSSCSISCSCSSCSWWVSRAWPITCRADDPMQRTPLCTPTSPSHHLASSRDRQLTTSKSWVVRIRCLCCRCACSLHSSSQFYVNVIDDFIKAILFSSPFHSFVLSLVLNNNEEKRKFAF